MFRICDFGHWKLFVFWNLEFVFLKLPIPEMKYLNQ
jgi:hypothetical protein